MGINIDFFLQKGRFSRIFIVQVGIYIGCEVWNVGCGIIELGKLADALSARPTVLRVSFSLIYVLGRYSLTEETPFSNRMAFFNDFSVEESLTHSSM